tara:strand:- start:259 stop:618 length:360 start_codon:yes stop_codon:yes gene_type:complete
MSKVDTIKTQLVIITGFLIFGILINSVLLIQITAALAFLFLVIPKFGELTVKVWFKIAEILGKINTYWILGLVFYVVLVPLGLLFKFTSKNPLQLRNDSDSLYKERNHLYNGEDLENIW